MISPLGLYQALSIMANGALDEIQEEILQVLLLNENIEK